MPALPSDSRSRLSSALFGTLSGSSEQMALVRAIEMDDPALAEAALQNRSPFQQMKIEGLNYPSSFLRQQKPKMGYELLTKRARKG